MMRNLHFPGHHRRHHHPDIAAAALGPEKDSLEPTSSLSMRDTSAIISNIASAHNIYHDEPKPRLLDRIIDSFRRDPGFAAIENYAIARAQRQRHTQQRRRRQRSRGNGNAAASDCNNADDETAYESGSSNASTSSTPPYYDIHLATIQTSHTALARRLKSRHLQMIAFAGSVGTGLFVASGRALEAGGPGSVLIAFLIVGLMLYCTVQALGELAVMYPVAGSFSSWATRFIDPSWGFAMGWK